MNIAQFTGVRAPRSTQSIKGSVSNASQADLAQNSLTRADQTFSGTGLLIGNLIPAVRPTESRRVTVTELRY